MRIKKKSDLLRLMAGRDRAAEPPPQPPGPQRILGVDTALRTTGFGIIDADGPRLAALDCGVIKSPARAPLSACLRRLAGGMRELIETYAPDLAVIEGAFYCRNVRTAMILGSARGAVIAVLAEKNIPIYEYAPRKVKQSICGYGNAGKQQVALLVAQFLNIKVDNLADDATDALALAICHAQGLLVARGLGLPPTL